MNQGQILANVDRKSQGGFPSTLLANSNWYVIIFQYPGLLNPENDSSDNEVSVKSEHVAATPSTTVQEPEAAESKSKKISKSKVDDAIIDR